MATTKISALTELTDAELADILAIVDDPGGTPATKKITLQNLLRSQCAWTQIYVGGGTGSQTLAAATWTKLTQFTTDGSSLNITPDQANDQITIVDAGRYLCLISVSAEISVAAEVQVIADVGGSKQDQVRAEGETAGVTTRLNLNASGFLSLSASDNVGVFAQMDNAGDFDVKQASLSLLRVPF